MDERIKNFKYLEEFELVDNSKNEIYNDKETIGKEDKIIDNTGNKRTYIEKNVYIEPIYISATSIDYKVYYIDENNSLEELGTVKSDNQIVLNAKYKDSKSVENEFDFDSKKLEVDIQKMLEKQRLRDEEKSKSIQDEKSEKNIENSDSIENEKEDKEENKEENKEEDKKEQDNNKKEAEENNKDDSIKDEDLKKQGYNITSYTKITDQHVKSSMIVENYNPNSLIVAEVDGQIKLMAKEVGTGEIKEIPLKTVDNSMEEVNEFSNNAERSKGAGTKITSSSFPGMEFNVNKNRMGQIEVGLIGNIDEQGNREVLSIGSPVHPTEQEYKRAESEKYERFGYGQILTKDEVDERLADEVESVRDEVGQEIETMAKNPTLQELEEKINAEKERQEEIREQEIEENEDEKEDEEYEKVPWDRHPHP